MNLTKLFDTQDILDKKIKEEKGLQGVDLLDKKILALQVELGELANEWRGFKFWSEDQEPRYETVEPYIHGYDGPGQNTRASIEDYQREPLLEEYVDCLHFILSIGNDLSINNVEIYDVNNQKNTVDAFNRVYKSIVDLIINIDLNRYEGKWMEYSALFNNFINLGELLGFTWKEIEQAYYDKNKINHQRQDEGY